MVFKRAIFIVAILILASWRPISAETPQTVYNVNQTTDEPDANIGDGICDSDLSTSGNQCTIRAAIDEANDDGTINAVAIPAGTYFITEDALEVTGGELTILGAFNNGTILDGTDSDSGILFVRDGATVIASLLTFQNGSGGCFPVVGCGMGGAITNQGTLTIQGSTVRDNRTSANGGGIVNNQTITIEDSTLENNRAGQVGGAIYSAGYDYPNTTTIRNTTIRDNLSTGGGGLYVADANVLLDEVTVQHNAAFGTPSRNSYGGGLSVKSSSDPFNVTILNSLFADNYSEASGGAIFTSNVVTISGSEFRYNWAAQRGGAIFSQLKATTVGNSLFFGNEAGIQGGAFFQNTDDLTISTTAVVNNTAQTGGAIYGNNFAGDTSLENVTISGNTATEMGGGLYIANDVTAKYVTIAANGAANGSAVAFGDGELRLGSSIIGSHSAPICEQGDGTFTSLGHNVLESVSGCTVSAVSGDQFNANADLLPLQNNEGITHELGEDSVALEAGDSADCPSFDQRGVSRPVNGDCDAGALEHDPTTDSQAWVPADPLPPFQYATFPTIIPFGATFTVDTAADGSDSNRGDGNCATSGGDCTLRAAVQESNATFDLNTIILPADTYTLNSQLDTITDHLLIDGAGRDTTTIVRNTNGNGMRVDYGTVVTIRDVTMGGGSRFISNYGLLRVENCVLENNTDSSIFTFYNYGDAMPTEEPFPEVYAENCIFRNNVGAFNGAAINADGKVTVSNSLFENNAATNGAAIYTTGGAGVTESGDIIVSNSQFVGNSAENQGGAIRSRWSRISVNDSHFINNTVENGSQPQGGAIATSSWITITDSYFEGNNAQYAGGAIANGGSWDLDISPAILGVTGSAFVGNSADFGGGIVFEGNGTLTRSTFSGNTALSDGGGLLIAAGSTGTLNSLTIANNIADSDNDNDGVGGGLQLSPGLWDDPGSFTIQNSIIANNSAFTGADCSAEIGTGLSLGSNLLEATADCAIFTNGSDLTGIDPQLSPLIPVQNHNRVHLPLPASPVVDSGGDCGSVDQRGAVRGDCDRGSVELTPPQTFVINANDGADDSEPGDGICATAAGGCTFTAAVHEANVWNYEDAITVPAGTFVSDDLIISGGDLTITGAGADQTTLTANLTRAGNARVLTTGTIFAPDQQITVQDLAITGGDLGFGLAQLGGGIYNVADLTLSRVWVHDNRGGNGGGIANSSAGKLTIADSTISDNTAQWLTGRGNGGGIYNGSSATVDLTNVTVSGNTAGQYGGGVVHLGANKVALEQVTVANNQASNSYGGGVVNGGSGVLSLENTIVGDNAAGTTDPDCYGAITVVRNRVLVEDNSTNCDPTNLILTGDAGLRDLGDYGGTTLTHAIASAFSPAVDVGGTNCPPLDQRGYARNGDCDLGAYEFSGVPTAIGLVEMSTSSRSWFPLTLLLVSVYALLATRRYITRFY